MEATNFSKRWRVGVNIVVVERQKRLPCTLLIYMTLSKIQKKLMLSLRMYRADNNTKYLGFM